MVDVPPAAFPASEDDRWECNDPSPSVVPRTRKSVTSDLFHQWLASGSSGSSCSRTSSGLNIKEQEQQPQQPPASASEYDMELLAQNDKLMELILDISNELDINVLCHKILVNVCRLTKLADRSSLFLARGPRGNRYLEAKLFDVKVDTSKFFIGLYLNFSSFGFSFKKMLAYYI